MLFVSYFESNAVHIKTILVTITSKNLKTLNIDNGQSTEFTYCACTMLLAAYESH